MPFGHQLKISDRRDLYARLIQEYFATDTGNPGVLKSWLIGKSRADLASCREAGDANAAEADSPKHQR